MDDWQREQGVARRRRIAMVSDIVPSQQSTSGFAARLRHFLIAAGERLDVTLVLIRRPFQDDDLDEVGSIAGVTVRLLRVDGPVWTRRDTRGRLARAFFQYPLDPLPFDCHPRRLPQLRQVLADAQPDVVALYLPYLAHLAGHAPGGAAVIGVLEEGWERVVSFSLEDRRWKKAWLTRRETARFASVYRRLDRRARAVVAISDDERRRFGATIAPGKIAVIPHGIDTAYFAPQGKPEQDIDVLVVGDLRAPRNYDGALRAWAASKEVATWRWAFVGAIEADLAAQLTDAGALVTGSVDDVRPYYDRTRAVLVPALEGSGVKTTSLQAWAMQRALVATPVGAQGLPARPHENILVADDADGLVEHLRQVVEDPALAQRLGAEGRRTVQADRDLAVVARAFADLCLEAAGPARSVSPAAGVGSQLRPSAVQRNARA